MSNVHGKNAIKYYKVTNEEALKTIHEFFEKRTAFLNRVKDFMQSFDMTLHAVSDDLFFGIQLRSIGVLTSNLDQYNLVTDWKKDSKYSNDHYTALLPRKTNKKLFERFEREFPRETLSYNELLAVIHSRSLDFLERGSLDHFIYIPNKCLLIADKIDYEKKPVCEEISKEELQALMCDESYILATPSRFSVKRIFLSHSCSGMIDLHPTQVA